MENDAPVVGPDAPTGSIVFMRRDELFF